MNKVMTKKNVVSTEPVLSRSEYEDFLYHEAALLDAWQLDEWFELFAEGATYEVPTAGAPDDADSAEALFYIADDYFRLRHRVKRLNSKQAHSEWPRSKTVHTVTNVRILGAEPEGVRVTSNFVTYRSKNNVTHTFVGRHYYLLRKLDGHIRIVSKRSMIDLDNLRPQGRVSIIV
jgi:p-cumate 2,3-dioxygenase beta subunit